MNISNDIEILLVEDNAFDAELTLNSLKSNNISNNIYHVEDGEEALDFLYCRGKFADRNEKGKPSVVLLDLKLPKIGGLEVLKILKNDPDKKSIPIVVLTSSAEEIDIYRSYDLGANSYIVKPVDFNQFSSTIKELGFYWLVLNKQ